MSAPPLDSCSYRWQPVRGTSRVMTASLPEIHSAAGMGGCVWNSLHVPRGEGTQGSRLTTAQCTVSTDKLALLYHNSRVFISSVVDSFYWCLSLPLEIPLEFLFCLFLLTAYGDLSLWRIHFEIS